MVVMYDRVPDIVAGRRWIRKSRRSRVSRAHRMRLETDQERFAPSRKEQIKVSDVCAAGWDFERGLRGALSLESHYESQARSSLALSLSYIHIVLAVLHSRTA